jgi:hypothetical protein
MFWTPEGFQAEIDYKYEQLRKAGAGRPRGHRPHVAAALRHQLRLPTQLRRGHSRRHPTVK